MPTYLFHPNVFVLSQMLHVNRHLVYHATLLRILAHKIQKCPSIDIGIQSLDNRLPLTIVFLIAATPSAINGTRMTNIPKKKFTMTARKMKQGSTANEKNGTSFRSK